MAKLRVKVKLYIGREARRGGHYFLYNNSAEIGDAHVSFEHKDTTYPLSGFKPAKTAVIDSFEVNESERGKGYGRWFINEIEKDARRYGMLRINLTSVMSDAESFWEKSGYNFSGHRRVWEKNLKATKSILASEGKPLKDRELAFSRKSPRITPKTPKLRR